MLRRVAALLVALVMCAAPIAATVCAARCERQSMDATTGHAHHHSCASQATESGTGIGAGPHACGHDSSDPAAIQQALQLLTAPALAAQHPFALVPAPTAPVVVAATTAQERPPGLLALISQLRV